jgi:hypothetical protein
MTAIGDISDMEVIVKASWSLFQYDGAAAFTVSERSPLRPALSAKDLPGGQTHILNVCQIRRINHHSVESEEDIAHESISDTDDWLNWNSDLDTPNDSKDDCAVDSIRNGSGPSLRVLVRVGSERSPNAWSGSSFNPNC